MMLIPKSPTMVLLEDIEDNPYQVRMNYDQLQLVQLAESIKELGLLQTPVARQVGEKYQLAFGHRRKRAWEMLCQEGSKVHNFMPIYVMELSDREMFEISLTENLKRQDLNPLEKATALKQYMDEFNATSAQAAKLFGIPESTVRGTIRLLNLPEEEKQKMLAGQLSQTKAREILSKPETKEKRPYVRAEAPDDGEFDLRDALTLLVYGAVRDVPDEVLFKKVKAVFEEMKALERQIEMMNSRKNDAARMKVSYEPQ
jgi:ParB/RepB/Spo0J family partition protein